jgi:hypothetical protein
VEVDQTGHPAIDALLTEPLDIRDGWLHLSEEPGLGIELNPRTLEALTVPAHQLMLEGSYSDLIFGPGYFATPPPYKSNATDA